jgi:hypothetical protein
MKLKCLLILFVLFLTGCSGSTNQTANQPEASASSSPQSSAQSSPVSEFEKDLQFIRNGGFTYVWLISRKDGKPLEPGDTIFLKANAPQVVDWVRTDDGKKVFAGTNFNLEEGNLEVLKRRYNMEDYSGK